MRESTVERYLADRVKAMGGRVRKVQWPGTRGAPDRLVMLEGRHFYVELKRPGEKPDPHQIREHIRMMAAGMDVRVANSKEAVDYVLSR